MLVFDLFLQIHYVIIVHQLIGFNTKDFVLCTSIVCIIETYYSIIYYLRWVNVHNIICSKQPLRSSWCCSEKMVVMMKGILDPMIGPVLPRHALGLPSRLVYFLSLHEQCNLFVIFYNFQQYYLQLIKSIRHWTFLFIMILDAIPIVNVGP